MAFPLQLIDVSTPEARARALENFEKYGWMIHPTGWLAVKLYRGLRSMGADAAAKEVAAQRQAAIDIIRAGKEHGVAELEITMSQDAGLSFGSTFEGLPVQAKGGTSGTMTLRVRYKTDDDSSART
jgi:hypothetical protein